jgi:hypothetical protein
VDDTARFWRRFAGRLVSVKPFAYVGVGAVSAGVWLQFGMPFGLITGGGLLIADALT